MTAANSREDRHEPTQPPVPERPIRTMTFIVRMSESETGAVAGVVEQPSTGRKERFHGVATIGDAVASLLGTAPLDSGADGPPKRGGS